jgi:hypothetical protein
LLLTHWGQRAQVDDDGGKIFVRHSTEVLVGHDRKQRAAVMADAFANGARQLVVGPIAGAGFWIRRDVGRNDSSDWSVTAGAFVGTLG